MVKYNICNIICIIYILYKMNKNKIGFITRLYEVKILDNVFNLLKDLLLG